MWTQNKSHGRLTLPVLGHTWSLAWASPQSTCPLVSLKPWRQLIHCASQPSTLVKKGNSSGHLVSSHFLYCWFSVFPSPGQPPAIKLSCNILHFQEISFHDDEKFHHFNHLQQKTHYTFLIWFKPGFLPRIQFPLAVFTKTNHSSFSALGFGAYVGVIGRGGNPEDGWKALFSHHCVNTLCPVRVKPFSLCTLYVSSQMI